MAQFGTAEILIWVTLSGLIILKSEIHTTSFIRSYYDKNQDLSITYSLGKMCVRYAFSKLENQLIQAPGSAHRYPHNIQALSSKLPMSQGHIHLANRWEV